MRSTSSFSSIFENGKLKPGIYKIQNIYTETYLDIKVHSREVCCRPAEDLREGRGLWEIKSLGAGYTVQRVDPGKPEQFCTPEDGIQDGTTLRVAAYPVAWRVETADDDGHRGFEYVRFCWGARKTAWDLPSADSTNGALVQTYPETLQNACQIWKLIPVDVGSLCLRPLPGTPGLGCPPSYEANPAQPSARTQHTELESDELGTVVNEVTVVTTTVTTRKRYRVDDT